MEDKIRKLKAIKAHADRGVGEEKKAAQEKLSVLCKKWNISIDQLEDKPKFTTSKAAENSGESIYEFLRKQREATIRAEEMVRRQREAMGRQQAYSYYGGLGGAAAWFGAQQAQASRQYQQYQQTTTENKDWKVEYQKMQERIKSETERERKISEELKAKAEEAKRKYEEEETQKKVKLFLKCLKWSAVAIMILTKNFSAAFLFLLFIFF